jgi:hypothetical protein
VIASIGKVKEVREVIKSRYMAVVEFEDTGLVSDWLYILKRPLPPIEVNQSGGHNHQGAVSIEPSHTHDARQDGWLPEAGDRVLVLYLPVQNGDGFILGGV